jgi:hypothetical protein
MTAYDLLQGLAATYLVGFACVSVVAWFCLAFFVVGMSTRDFRESFPRRRDRTFARLFVGSPFVVGVAMLVVVLGRAL